MITYSYGINLSEHTIDSKSIRKQSLTLSLLRCCPRLFWAPPKSTAWWSLMAVKEWKEQGGGLVPVVEGEDHFPAINKVQSENQVVLCCFC